MIDSHCHLTHPHLRQAVEQVLRRAQADGVTGMITIGTSPADAREAIALCHRWPQVRCAVGIHPNDTAAHAISDMEQIASACLEAGVVAVGETGLDYFHRHSPREVQAMFFEAHLHLSRRIGRPVVIHCRQAVDDTLAILRNHPGVRSVFHCFTGAMEEAKRILDAGHFIGLTGPVTFKKSHELREVAAMIPSDRLLVETDAPYLTPEPFRKQSVNEPAMVMHTARMVASVRGIPLPLLDEMTTANTANLFGWPTGSCPPGRVTPVDPDR